MSWISVKEQLPPQDGTPFLGYDPTKDLCVDVHERKKISTR